MKITEELLAAYLEGKTNKEQTLQVLSALKTDANLRKMVEISMAVDDELGEMPEFMPTPVFVIMRSSVLPMLKFAAKDNENICSVACESYILQRHNIPHDLNELIVMARENNWLKEDGTPLYAIGQLLAMKGQLITRKYDATIDDIIRVLALDNDVIVAVDIEKLYSEQPFIDENVNHAVVVTAVNLEEETVSVFDPKKNAEVSIPLSYFQNAWNDSHNYMVRVLKSIYEYEPEPIKTEEVTLSDILTVLQEAIAENAHDVWAINRIKEGWKWGPRRDDEKKENPDLVPYCALPEGEKEYDRQTAMGTIKLIQKLGFEIKMP